MAKETKLLYLTTIDSYEIFIEDCQQELYERAIVEDAPIDLLVWIRVVLNDADGVFDSEEDEDMLINTTYHGKMSDFECELKKLISSEQFQKEAHFDFNLDGPYQQQLPFQE